MMQFKMTKYYRWDKDSRNDDNDDDGDCKMVTMQEHKEVNYSGRDQIEQHAG